MRRIAILTLLVSFSVMTVTAVQAKQVKYPHKDFIDSYDGTQTCLGCHEKEAKQFVHSVHYLWMGDSPNLVNIKDKKFGKANTTNDFCTNPMINWIGILKNSHGQVIGQGCSVCHAGLGKKPQEKEDDAELNNIDCLVCHAPASYKRHVVKKDGKFVWEPVGTHEQVTALAQKVGMPTRDNCLRCHIKAGGGPNFKRGDIEPTLKNAPRDFDVHMSPKGMNMNCTDCHRGKEHKIAGGGVDNPTIDVKTAMSCEGCHTFAPHKSPLLNKHARTVACETCHIPTFAKQYPTDVFRDWSKTEYHKKHDKYEPAIKFQKNVTPRYAWWNGKTWYQDVHKPIKLDKNGKFVISRPVGDIKDVHAKIFPFKYHEAKLPYDPATMQLIPIKVGKVFKAGNWKAAIIAGAKAFYGKAIKNFKFAISQRWMGIYHEVTPKEKALQCSDCHTEGKGRLDWKALGYPGDPMRMATDRFKLFRIKTDE